MQKIVELLYDYGAVDYYLRKIRFDDADIKYQIRDFDRVNVNLLVQRRLFPRYFIPRYVRQPLYS